MPFEMNFSDKFKEIMGMVEQNAQQLKKDLTLTPFPSGPEVWEAGRQNGEKMKGEVARKQEGPIKAVGRAIKTNLDLLGSPEWMSHAYVDQELNKPHMNKWAGGYNRKSRNAGSFYGGYDAAMRWPDKAEELKTLAKGYQMLDAVKSIGRKGGDLSNEMEDALANISGIEAAQRDMENKRGYKVDDTFNEDIAALAKEYADKYTRE